MSADLFTSDELVSMSNVNTRITSLNTDISTLNGKFPVSIANGGTGGTTSTEARTNLEVMKGTSLWGNSSGTTSTMTFNGNYSTYDYIYIQGMDNGVATCNIFRPVTASKVSVFNLYATDATSPTGMYYHGCYLDFSYSSSTNKTTVTFTRNGTYTIKMAANTADTWSYSSGQGIYITKIMGYKY